tara:strand:+ start:16 stop:240 length:225 start_codon:yes stop_codon:yes gene_type:complete
MAWIEQIEETKIFKIILIATFIISIIIWEISKILFWKIYDNVKKKSTAVNDWIPIVIIVGLVVLSKLFRIFRIF